MELALRRVKPSDSDFLLALRKVTMGQHLEAAGLYLTDEQHIARIRDGYEDICLIQWQGNTVGMIKCHVCDKVSHIGQLQILPEFQGRGLGRGVIEQVIQARSGGKVTLSVLKQNRARHLYLRMGFVQVGEDDREYHMCLNLAG